MKEGTGLRIKVKVATILLSKADPPLERSEFIHSVPPESDAGMLIDDLGIPRRLVGSITVNKKRCTWERPLADCDSVAVVPAISGG